ncbi:TonB-linked outer membrane protein, SusC/RagA family [Reichenbachiella agariperforans]|uniref:TonB-linked outer membrane protein, SusC/RagA family n=1 Tax=Reichenbachiella agariperforans TaxID=156994 RepID=A0A1M6UE81_REIAG|nr:SusC/RagA family TonB-linked outer membrane protein [Reichenbachiella agariperforans]SHK67471.1 TonB-linked outer membrane protein, SusC/RagA family [Reichenbachiella agariperforans]
MKYIQYIIALATVLFGFAQVQAQQVEEVVLQDTLGANKKQKVHLPFGDMDKNRVVGATSLITQDQITTADLDVESAMIGKAMGLNVFKNSAGPGSDNSWLNVRGLHTIGGDGPLVVVDGVSNRSLESLNFYEIESITVLKDITAKSLYGPQAANGVILVTTKRGEVGVKKASINAEYGFRKPTHLPDFLNSADYARLYNEAQENDGLTPQYSDADIAAYESAGINDELPNVDYYDRYLKSFTNYQRIYGTYSNADEKTAFYFTAGYAGEGGLEAIGEQTKYNSMNVRGNLDYKINDIFSVQVDVAARLETTSTNQMTYSNYDGTPNNLGDNNTVQGFFSTLSSHRPNEYPIYHNAPTAESPGELGWGAAKSTNIEGELLRAGYRDELLRQSQSNIGLDMDFTQWGIEGLSWKNYVSFDTYNFLITRKKDEYARYQADGTQVGDDVQASGISKFDDSAYRNIGMISTMTYDRTFGDHAFTSHLNAIAQNREYQGTAQPYKNVTYGYRLNYAFANKYIAEVDLTYMGSNKLEEGSRYEFFPSVGLGWVLSEEGFLQSVDALDYLKIKASYGQMGYDRSLQHFWYRDAYGPNGWVQFGSQNSNGSSAYNLIRAGNPAIGFEIATEYNIGLEALIMKNLSVEANYFNEYRSDIPMQVSSLYPDYFGDYIPYINYGEVSNQGVELGLNYSGQAGDISYGVGGYVTYSEAIYEKTGDLTAFSHLNRDGQPLDAMWGYNSEGFYTDASEVNVQSTLGGDVIAGDLKYTDITEDGLITVEDQKVIANTTPRYQYSLNFNIGYKGLGLSVLGQGAAGHDRMMSWNTAYNGVAQGKYAANAMNRWTPDNLDASHPRLTTVGGAHSYQGSSFWLQDASYFTIRNIELSYAFPEKIRNSIRASELRVFARGTDLFSFSGNSDFNSDNAASGLSNGFLMKTVSLGFNLSY